MLLAAAIPDSARAQPDAAIRVAPSHAGSEIQPRILSDHAGGAFVGFVEGDTFHVARLRSDATPDPNWWALLVPDLDIRSPSGSRFAVLRPGTIVAFSDFFHEPVTEYPPPWWYRPSGDGGILSPDYSATTTIRYSGPELVEQPNGTVLVVALGNNVNTAQAELRNAYLLSTGALVEGFTTPLSGTASNVEYAAVCRAILADGGGAWAVGEVYEIGTGTSWDLTASRINMDGTSALTPTARTISAAARNQRQAALATDGAGGMFVTWTDGRTLATADDIYAMHLVTNGSLAVGWTAAGKVICNAAGSQVQPAIAGDGTGGVWIGWADGRSGENDIYYTHVLGNGTLAAGFPAGGLPLCDVAGGQADLQLAGDGAGGFFALWLDQRDGEADLYGIHVAADGSVIPNWVADGSPITTHPSLQRTPRLLVMDPHRAFAVWSDSRTGTENVYVAVLSFDQALSVPRANAATLSLRATPVPARGEVELVLASTGVEPVDISLLDAGGRVIARERVEAGGSTVPVRFGGRRLAPGLYLARASQAGLHADCRVIVLR
jgi:hypothetical protein